MRMTHPIAFQTIHNALTQTILLVMSVKKYHTEKYSSVNNAVIPSFCYVHLTFSARFVLITNDIIRNIYFIDYVGAK